MGGEGTDEDMELDMDPDLQLKVLRAKNMILEAKYLNACRKLKKARHVGKQARRK